MRRDYLDGVQGVVEATRFEEMCLWKMNSEKNKTIRMTWEENCEVYAPIIGHVDSYPVVLSIRSAIINGFKILFIEPTSMMVDHKMIAEWLEKNLPASAFKGKYVNAVDAMNFQNVFPR